MEILRDIKEKLVKTTSKFGYRQKLLNCLYSINKLLLEPEITLKEILQGIIELLLLAFHHTRISGIRIIIKDKIYKSNKFEITRYKISSKIFNEKEEIGLLEIYYNNVEEKERFFNREDVFLIDIIAEKIGNYLGTVLIF